MIKTAAKWSYRPYEPFGVDRGEIFITRIVPDKNGFSVDWLADQAEKVTIYYGKREEEQLFSQQAEGGRTLIAGLEEGVDYRFYLEAQDGKKSLTRLVRTGDYIHTVIQYVHPEDEAYTVSGHFLGSPSVLRQADGSLLATMDVFASYQYARRLSLVYRSEDNGKTWDWQCELFPCFWGKTFLFKGETYMLCCQTGRGDILLGKSLDCGRTFENPTVLYRSPGVYTLPGVSMSPTPLMEFAGRIWFNFHIGDYSMGYAIVVASAPLDSDLLDVNNWTITQPCVYDENWPGTAKGKSLGTMEGTFIVLPDGKPYIMCRYDMGKCEPDYGMAVLYKVNTEDPAASPEFYRTVKFEGNNSKYQVHQDKLTKNYYTIMSRITDSSTKHYRNLLSLMKSEDGIHWELVKDIYDFRDKDPAKNGFQYVDFFIEGDDIYYASRTGINGSDTHHNTNCILFNIIKNFREL